MKKIILSLAIISAVAVIVIGGTAAYFTATDSSTGNTFTAGNMEIYANENGIYGDTGTGNGLPFTVSNMSPGNNWGPVYAAVANKGTIPFKWAFSMNKTDDTPGTGGGNLYNVLKVEVEAVMDASNTAIRQYDYQTGFDCQNTSLNWHPVYGDNAAIQTTAGGATYSDSEGFVANGTYPDKMGQIDPDKGVCFRFTTYLDGNLINVSGTDVDDNAFQNAQVIYEMVVDAYQVNDPAYNLIP